MRAGIRDTLLLGFSPGGGIDVGGRRHAADSDATGMGRTEATFLRSAT